MQHITDALDGQLISAKTKRPEGPFSTNQAISTDRHCSRSCCQILFQTLRTDQSLSQRIWFYQQTDIIVEGTIRFCSIQHDIGQPKNLIGSGISLIPEQIKQLKINCIPLLAIFPLCWIYDVVYISVSLFSSSHHDRLRKQGDLRRLYLSS